MKAVALIPSIGRSPYLRKLVENLIECDVKVIIVDNLPTVETQPTDNLPEIWNKTEYLWRPNWRGIYRQWNLGLRYGALVNLPTLILNDDVVIERENIDLMVKVLAEGEWAILGFDYFPVTNISGRTLIETVQVFGTYRRCGVGGFAFGALPRRCARIDERFRWWGGDDDLVHATMAKGEKVGLLRGALVEHPQPSLTANSHGHLLPDNWADNDRDLLISKWGEGW